MSSLRVQTLDLSSHAVARQVLDLQHASYRGEAELIGFDAIPPLRESLAELQRRQLCWRGVLDEEGQVIAAIGYTTTADRIDIDRLMVAPTRFREGLGAKLLGALDPRRRAIVSTGAGNAPARKLYLSQGFRESHQEEVVPGLFIQHFVREGAG